jgi:hypothetical protein
MSIEAMKQALDELENCADLLRMFEAPIDSCVGGTMLRAEKAADTLRTAIEQAEKQEPVAFKIYKPTPPRGAIPDVRDAELPWVYDQDPSSGNVASMWVTPVKATPPAAPVQEPVAWITQGGKGWLRWHNKNDDHLNKTSVPLYKHPKRKPLSDAEIALISAECSLRTPSDIYFARAIEAAHGIK